MKRSIINFSSSNTTRLWAFKDVGVARLVNGGNSLDSQGTTGAVKITGYSGEVYFRLQSDDTHSNTINFQISGTTATISMNEEVISIEGNPARINLENPEKIFGEAKQIKYTPAKEISLVGEAVLRTTDGELKSKKILYQLGGSN